MKTKFIVLLIFLLNFQVFAQINQHDLALYLSLDGEAVDIGDNTYLPEIIGNPTTTEGIVGEALSFDGIDDCIIIPNFDNAGSMESSFTFTGWIKPQSLYNEQWVTLLNHRNNQPSTTPFTVAYWKGSHLVPYVRFTGPEPATWTSVRLQNSPVSLTLGEWNFIAWRFNNGQLTIFLNGEVVGAHSFGFDEVRSGEGTLEIGRDTPGEVEYFHGCVDELSVFKEPLTDEEIVDVYEQGLSGKPLFSESTTSTDEETATNSITLFPNPASNFVNWRPVTVASYKLFNSAGQQVRKGIGSQVDVAGLPTGLYYLSLDGKTLKKIMVKKRFVYP